MLAKDPDVAGFGDGCLSHLGCLVFVGQAIVTGITRNKFVPLFGGKAGEAQIKASFLQLSQFKAQQVVIPGRVLADLVVSQDQCLSLDLGQVFHGHDGHLGHAELAGSKQPAVTCDDVVLSVHQDGSTPAKLGDAGRDLCHMGVRVQLGISGVRDQGLNRPVLDFDVGLHAVSETKKPARDILVAGC